jgi:hypothetical protein
MAPATASPVVLKQHYRGKDGKLYRSGTEVDKIPESAQIKVGEGSVTLAGTTTDQATPTPTNPAPPPAPAPTPAPPAPTPTPVPAAEIKTELPSGFPARSLLLKNGLDTIEKVDEASDETLLNIDGVGDTTLQAIRAAVK